ncbi:hypothetical protein [Candidatus Clostridium radicumherbarum]|uniref:Uncharacterized protein n=1 Tax=Candidatus Clostridium radicumherbarum TaxID=3381662 RepID=A0ABW8TT90_9CLOT
MGKIKNLPPKENLENIWYYYKWHIFACIFAVLAAVVLIGSYLTREKYIINLSMVGYFDNSRSQEVSNFQNDITKLLVPEANKRTSALVELYRSKDSSGKLKELEPADVEKLSVKIAAKEVDILIMNKDDFNNYMNEDTFLKLDDLKLDNANKAYKLVRANSSVYGISVEGNKLLDKIGYDTKDKVIGIVVNTKNKESSEKVINWILKLQ